MLVDFSKQDFLFSFKLHDMMSLVLVDTLKELIQFLSLMSPSVWTYII